MTLQALDHVNVRTANLDAMIAWYDDVLGMAAGKRPDFGFPGAWLYIDDRPVVHLVGMQQAPQSVEPQIEHFAIRASGLETFLGHLNDKGVVYKLATVPGMSITQVNIFDPDGNRIHVDFD